MRKPVNGGKTTSWASFYLFAFVYFAGCISGISRFAYLLMFYKFLLEHQSIFLFLKYEVE